MVERRTFLKGSALAAGVALLEACGERRAVPGAAARAAGRPARRRGVEAVGVRSVRGRLRNAGPRRRRRRAQGRGAARAPDQPWRAVRAGSGRAPGPLRPRPGDGADGAARSLGGGGRREDGGAASRIEARRSKPSSGTRRWPPRRRPSPRAVARDPSSIVFVDGSGNTFLHALLARLARRHRRAGADRARAAAPGGGAARGSNRARIRSARRLRPAALRLHSLDRSRLPRSRRAAGVVDLGHGPGPRRHTRPSRQAGAGRSAHVAHRRVRRRVAAGGARRGGDARSHHRRRAPGRGARARRRRRLPAPSSTERRRRSKRALDAATFPPRRSGASRASCCAPSVRWCSAAARRRSSRTAWSSTTAALALNLLLGAVGRAGGVHPERFVRHRRRRSIPPAPKAR